MSSGERFICRTFARDLVGRGGGAYPEHIIGGAGAVSDITRYAAARWPCLASYTELVRGPTGPPHWLSLSHDLLPAELFVGDGVFCS